MDTALSLVECNTTATPEIDADKEIKIFPNPANEFLYYQLTDENISLSLVFEIFDVTGRLIKTISEQEYSGQIDISELKRGSYILKIIQGSKIITRRFIKD